MARRSKIDIENSAPIHHNIQKVGAYLRLSVEDNNGSTSIENQQNIIGNFINNNTDFTLIDIYKDNGFTGTNFHRPEFNRLIEDAEKGKINCIIVKDLSRIGRNYIDVGYYLERYLPSKNIRVIAINDNFDSLNNFNSDNQIIVALKNVINESYSLDLARKLKLSKKQYMKEGKHIGGRATYGYKISEDDPLKLAIDNNSGAIVQEIFNLKAENIPLTKMAKILNEKGYPTPSQYRKMLEPNSNYKVANSWSTDTIRTILKNELYIGNMVQGMRESSNGKLIKLKKEDWIIIENTHEPIISKELFYKVQEIINNSSEKNKKSFSNDKRWNDKNFTPLNNIFKDKLVCGCCGSKLIKAVKRPAKKDNGKTIYYYYCKNNTPLGKVCNVPVKVNETDLLPIITDKLKNVVVYKNIKNKNTKYLDIEMENLKNKINKMNKEASNLFENYIKGDISKSIYEQLGNEYDEIIDADTKIYNDLLSEKTKLKQINQSPVGNKKNLITEENIQEYINKIVVNQDSEIEVFLYDNLPKKEVI